MQNPRRGWLACAAALVALALAVSACGHPPTPEASRSLTPRITQGSIVGLDEMELRTSDLQSVVGLPHDVVVGSVHATQLFADPDPRGPCGAKIDQPDLLSGEVVAIRGRPFRASKPSWLCPKVGRRPSSMRSMRTPGRARRGRVPRTRGPPSGDNSSYLSHSTPLSSKQARRTSESTRSTQLRSPFEGARRWLSSRSSVHQLTLQ